MERDNADLTVHVQLQSPGFESSDVRGIDSLEASATVSTSSKTKIHQRTTWVCLVIPDRVEFDNRLVIDVGRRHVLVFPCLL